jgi:hypothetical protein
LQHLHFPVTTKAGTDIFESLWCRECLPVI